jgi:hypothetical protein
VETGCPYCKVAMDYLDERQIGYEKVEVRGSDSKMKSSRSFPVRPRRQDLIGTATSSPISGRRSWKSFSEIA